MMTLLLHRNNDVIMRSWLYHLPDRFEVEREYKVELLQAHQ